MIVVFVIGISTPSHLYKFFTVVHLFDYDKKGENSKYFNTGIFTLFSSYLFLLIFCYFPSLMKISSDTLMIYILSSDTPSTSYPLSFDIFSSVTYALIPSHFK